MSNSPNARSSCITVDLDALLANYAHIKRLVQPASVRVVVKANGYGHGLVVVAQALQANGADGLCVALVEEGLALREAGITLPIWVLNGVYGDQHAMVINAALTPIVYEPRDLHAFNAAAHASLDVHLKVDTGMARLGVLPAQLESILDILQACKNLNIAGVMTHFASADTDPETTQVLLRSFEQALEQISRRGYQPEFIHAANSAATFRHPQSRYTTVRNGIAVYGVGPGLTPALSLTSSIVSIRTLDANVPVGYHTSFQTRRPSRIATVAVGYGDGYPRSLSNLGTVLVHGSRCPVVGEVSMDLTIIDITDVPQAALGDEVVLIGEQRGTTLSAQQVADAAQVSIYELFTRLMPRLPRRYIGGGQHV